MSTKTEGVVSLVFLRVWEANGIGVLLVLLLSVLLSVLEIFADVGEEAEVPVLSYVPVECEG